MAAGAGRRRDADRDPARQPRARGSADARTWPDAAGAGARERRRGLGRRGQDRRLVRGGGGAFTVTAGGGAPPAGGLRPAHRGGATPALMPPRTKATAQGGGPREAPP